MDPETRALVQEVADEAAVKAVAHTLLTLGLDPDNPIGVQRDMAALHELREMVDDPEFQKDAAHTRRWRKTMESVESKGVFAMLVLVGTGGIAFMLYAFRIKIFGGP